MLGACALAWKWAASSPGSCGNSQTCHLKECMSRRSPTPRPGAGGLPASLCHGTAGREGGCSGVVSLLVLRTTCWIASLRPRGMTCVSCLWLSSCSLVHCMSLLGTLCSQTRPSADSLVFAGLVLVWLCLSY